MAKTKKITLEALSKNIGDLAKTMTTGFAVLDKKIESLDKKIDDNAEELMQKMQRGFLEQIERSNRPEQDVADLKDGQNRIETNLAGMARNIDLMDLRAEVEILKRKV